MSDKAPYSLSKFARIWAGIGLTGTVALTSLVIQWQDSRTTAEQARVAELQAAADAKAAAAESRRSEAIVAFLGNLGSATDSNGNRSGQVDTNAAASCGAAGSDVYGGWGPDRPMYTDQFGSPYTTVNSLKVNPNIGDERAFFGVRRKGSDDGWSQQIDVRRGRTYTMRVYVHVDAPASGEASLAAHNVTAMINLPTCTGEVIASHAWISSSAFPFKVWSGVTFRATEIFNLAYVEGTMKYENNAGVFPLDTAVLTSGGTKLGFDRMDGEIKPGYAYSGYLSFDVRPQFAARSSSAVGEHSS